MTLVADVKNQCTFCSFNTVLARFHMITAIQDDGINLNIFGVEVNEERLEWLWYAASVFDPFQEWKDRLPVVDTATNVLLLVVVRVHAITLGY